MAVLSITTLTKLSHLFPTNHHHRHRHRPLFPFPTPLPLLSKPHLVRPISATQFPSPPSSPSGEIYQPFRPPPSPLPPQYRSLSPADRLNILCNRLGLWHDYAPLIPSLTNDGFTPPSIEEATGISGVEQNRLVVAAQIRDSLVSSAVDPEVLAYFDLGGAELLYELRLLNGPQRAASARRVVERRLDPKAAQQLARAVKDFPRRRVDPCWESFSAASPADCLAYSHFRLGREALSPADRVAALERALEEAETEAAKKRITEELAKATGKGEKDDDDELPTKVRLPVVRLRFGEVAESTSVVTLPVCDAAAGEAGVAEAPSCRAKGDFGVVTADKPWAKWVVLPGWGSVMTIREGGGAVAVAFVDAKVLPWRTNKWEKEEAVLVVVDRVRKDVAEEGGFYLVGKEGGGGLAVEGGSRLREAGVQEALGMVVVVVRPPRDDLDNQIADED